jgi:eukaryotic-like serine/threonine-protein kinase
VVKAPVWIEKMGAGMNDEQRLSQILELAFDQPLNHRRAWIEGQTRDEPALREKALEALDHAVLSSFLTGGIGAPTHSEGSVMQSLLPGALVGVWTIVEALDRGGMGEVYLVARADGVYEQRAALKIVGGETPNNEALRLFDAERRLLARLEHPGIARILDGGAGPDGRPFMVMDYVPGTSLSAAVIASGMALRARLQLFVKLLSAISHAHGRLVIHRDIKPANVMLTPEGEVKLLDFGVAALVSALQPAGPATIAVTPGYGAPELITGAPADVRTDVWGAGMVLFEMLTGRPPFEVHAILAGQTGPVALASTVTRAIEALRLQGDLDAILACALSVDPAERYASIELFAADIGRVLSHTPVSVRPPTPLYRMSRYVSRNRWQVLGAGGIAATLMIGLAGTLWQADQARQERDVARREEARLRAMQQATFTMFANAADRSENLDARALVKQSADRVRQEFDADPRAAAPVLAMFGELFFLMNDYEAAEVLLRPLVDAPSGVREEDRAMARHDLSVVYARRADFGEARVLLEGAQAYWNTRPQRYANEILSARIAEAQILTGENKVEAARDLLLTTVPQRLALSGLAHMETVFVYNSLGSAQFRLAAYDDALAAFTQAREALFLLGRIESPDGLNVMNNLASLKHVTGQRDEAALAYEEAIGLRRSLYGPSAALAVLLMNRAKLAVEQSDAQTALGYYDHAIPMADEFAGASSPPGIAARAGRVEALVLAGLSDEALRAARGLEELVEDAGQSQSVYGGLSLVASARALAASGQAARAHLVLDQAHALFTAIGPQAGRQLQAVEKLRAEIEPAQ